MGCCAKRTSLVFPVDVNVCTNVVTIVRYGEKEKIKALIEDSRKKDGYRSGTIMQGAVWERQDVKISQQGQSGIGAESE